METFNVVIVGGGPGCLAIMDMIASDRLRQLRMNLMGVADINPEAPGIRRAQALNVFTTTDYRDLFALKELNLILELTGSEEVSRSIQEKKPLHLQFIDHNAARLFWDIIQLEEEKRNAEREAEKKRLKAVGTLLKDMMQLEEEKLNAEKKAEKRIRAERDDTAKILNGLTEAVIVLNKDHVIEHANETFLKEFGAGHEKIIGKKCFEIIINRQQSCEDLFCPMVDRTLNTLSTNRKEYTFRRNGEGVYWEAIYNPLRDAQGEYTRCLISMANLTHRKKLELDLQKSQKKYKHLFQAAHDAILLFNRHGEIQESNLSLSHLVGYNKDELEHMKVSALTENASKKILSDHLEDLAIMGFVSVEMEFMKKSGDSLPVEASLTWLPEEEIFQLMARDISFRKRLEESRKLYSEKLEKEVDKRTQELRDSQQEALRQKKNAEGIIYGSPIPMFVLNQNHQITYWNKACEKLTGHTGEQMIGTDQHWKPFYPQKRPILADLIMEGDIETIHKLYEEMNLRKSPVIDGAYEAEHYFPHLGEDGTHLYFNAAPIKDDSGNIQGAIVTYQDFSERVKMLQEIRRREAFVQNLIQNSIDGILATDPEGKIVIFNRGCVNILGYSPDKIIGQSYTAILSREMTKKVRNAFYSNEYGPEGKIINMLFEMLNKQGNPIPVRLSGTLLYEKKREVGSVVFIQDLREILRLQKEKEQAERMAAIGQTVAGLAHYIKNILNGLKGGEYMINSAMEKNSIEMVAKGWRMVEKNIDQITQIVMDMLVYSKERKPDYQMVDANELVMDVLELIKERAELSGVSVVHELMPGLKKVPMDRTAIHRCLLNLVSNAIDACALEGIVEGNGLVTVKTDSPEGWAVRFQVIDNGTGMDEETQQKLFTGFFSTKGYKGTGLGLPVTQKIVKEHQGELFFKSELGKGTTFTLTLPQN
ncbi:MAG: PAS domain S-box protein [Deltaproteobacteria bacterium]|nr:MAG: PAS domain S-box protein [Deltaproteobacteria bacterium]